MADTIIFSENLEGWELIEKYGDDLKIIPKSLINGNTNYPFHNIRSAKYLLVMGMTNFDDINRGVLKSITGGDSFYDNL
jgi:hypothetical protein